MAAGFISSPGTEYGPCIDACDHHDCGPNRLLAAQGCAVCQEPIGYETMFYQEDNWTVLTHERCSLLVDQAVRMISEGMSHPAMVVQLAKEYELSTEKVRQMLTCENSGLCPVWCPGHEQASA